MELRRLAQDEKDTIRQRLTQTGRAQITDVLTPSAADRLLQAALGVEYNVVSRRSAGHMDMTAQWLDMLQPRQTLALSEAIQNAATDGFQYLFDNYPLYDLVQAGAASPYWRDIVGFLNGEAFLSMVRELTGEERIALADAQLTRFRRGHFLTEHSDEAEGKNRFYAYVLSLTPAWRIDWGGLLAFHGADGNVEEAFTPRFNTLNLLKVPAAHSVTQVALSAGGHRISITGWLRGA